MGEVARWWRDSAFPLYSLRCPPNQVGGRDEHDDLVSHGRERSYRPGDRLQSSQGYRHYDDAVILIEQGRAKETISTSKGQQLIWSICGPGDLVGIVEYLGWYRRECDVVALTPVRAVVISEQGFEKFLERRPALWRELAAAMAAEVGAAQLRMTEMAYDTAAARLAAILLDLIEPWEDPRHQHRSLKIPLTQADLAMLLGTRRETVERILQDWRRREIVTTEPRTITILHDEALAQIAGASIATVKSAVELDRGRDCSFAAGDSFRADTPNRGTGELKAAS